MFGHYKQSWVSKGEHNSTEFVVPTQERPRRLAAVNGRDRLAVYVLMDYIWVWACISLFCVIWTTSFVKVYLHLHDLPYLINRERMLDVQLYSLSWLRLYFSLIDFVVTLMLDLSVVKWKNKVWYNLFKYSSLPTLKVSTTTKKLHIKTTDISSGKYVVVCLFVCFLFLFFSQEHYH